MVICRGSCFVLQVWNDSSLSDASSCIYYSWTRANELGLICTFFCSLLKRPFSLSGLPVLLRLHSLRISSTKAALLVLFRENFVFMDSIVDARDMKEARLMSFNYFSAGFGIRDLCSDCTYEFWAPVRSFCCLMSWETWMAFLFWEDWPPGYNWLSSSIWISDSSLLDSEKVSGSESADLLLLSSASSFPGCSRIFP